MKLLSTILLVCMSIGVIGQSSFKTFKISNVERKSFEKSDSTFNDYKLISFSTSELKKYVDRSYDFSMIKLEFEDQEAIDLVIYPYDIRSEDYIAVEFGEEGAKYVSRLPNCTYRGYVNDASKGDVRLTLTEDFISFQFSVNGKMNYIENYSSYSKKRSDTELIYYNDNQLNKKRSIPCGVIAEDHELSPANKVTDKNHQAGSCYTVKMAIAVDYLMVSYIAHPSFSESIVQSLAVMNNVGPNYELISNDNFNDGLEFAITEHFGSTCLNCDPWTQSKVINDVLADFGAWGSSGGFSSDFDIAQLWTRRNFNGSSVGLAYTAPNLICNNSAYHVLQEFTNNLPYLRTMVAHEIGHNLSAGHDNTAGMIMSPSITDTDTWSAQSKFVINQEISSYLSNCTTSCAAADVNCQLPENITFSEVGFSGFTVSWNSMNNSTIQVQVKDLEDNSIVYNQSTTANSITIQPNNFEICKKYKVSVTNECGIGNGVMSNFVVESPVFQGCADFVSNSCIQWQGGAVQFTDKSMNAVSWFWDFGDGNFSTQQNPQHIYAEIGSYSVSLSVNGGVNIRSKTDYIKVLPQLGLPYSKEMGGDFDANTHHFATEAIQGGHSLFQWGTPNNGLTSSSNVWKTMLNEDIGAEENVSVLYSPKFNMSAYGLYTIEFDMGMEMVFCNAPAGARMEYSTNDGISWVRLGSYNDSGSGVSNWYNSGPGAPCALVSQIFPDQTGWAFTESNRHMSYDISFLAGNSGVVFRFLYSVSDIFTAGYDIDGIMLDNFEISASMQTLPLDDLTFSGQVKASSVLLDWDNSGEYNLDYYELQRSNDKMNFITIDKIQAANNAIENKYQREDQSPNQGINYYRLKAIDFDGSFEYSTIVSVKWEDSNNDLKIWPNPLSNQPISIQTGPEELYSHWSLATANGKVISSGNFNNEENELVQITTDELNSGIFFLSIYQKEGAVNVEKIIKI